MSQELLFPFLLIKNYKNIGNNIVQLFEKYVNKIVTWQMLINKKKYIHKG